MRQSFDSHRLHSVKIIKNGEAMEGETAVLEVWDCLHAERIGAPMTNFHSTTSTFCEVCMQAKYSPDTTHSLQLASCH